MKALTYSGRSGSKVQAYVADQMSTVILHRSHDVPIAKIVLLGMS